MADMWDTYNYLGRRQQVRLTDAMRERRRQAIEATSKVSVKIANADHSIKELIFDAPPTLAQLVESAGSEALIIGIGRYWPANRPIDRLAPR